MKTSSTNHFQISNSLVQQELCNCCGQKMWQKLYTNYDRLWAKKTSTYDIYQCLNCGLIVTETDRTPETIKAYYEGYCTLQKMNDKFLRIKIFLYAFLFRSLPSKPLEWLRNLLFYPLLHRMRGIEIKPQAKVLDIGCGSGRFLAIIKALKMIPFGIEIGEEAYESSKKITENIYLGQFETLDTYQFPNNPTMKFDIIVSNHVIEHVTAPNQFLQKVKSMLTDNGIAIIATPNYRSICAKLFRKYWVGLETPRHLFLLAPPNMQIYCDKCQLKIKKVRYLSNAFGIVGSIIYLYEDKWQRRAGPWLWKLLIIPSIFVFWPVCILVDLLRMGNTAEYYITHHK